jgi:hypothetical protein
MVFMPPVAQIHPFSSAEALFPGPSLRSSEPAFDLDLSRLEQQYKALQRRLHPDKFATGSPQEQEYAAQQATAINQAYDVLKRPLRRASYIVSHSQRQRAITSLAAEFQAAISCFALRLCGRLFLLGCTHYYRGRS